MIYDFCKTSADAALRINMKSTSGSYMSKLIARVEKTDKFKVLCTNVGNSDPFLPR